MSDRTFELEVAENAQRDIIEIRLYSTEVWGDQQADDYLVRLSGASSVRCPVRRARSDRRTPCRGDASCVSMTTWGACGTGQWCLDGPLSMTWWAVGSVAHRLAERSLDSGCEGARDDGGKEVGTARVGGGLPCAVPESLPSCSPEFSPGRSWKPALICALPIRYVASCIWRRRWRASARTPGLASGLVARSRIVFGSCSFAISAFSSAPSRKMMAVT
jgi:hypothetical protein